MKKKEKELVSGDKPQKMTIKEKRKYKKEHNIKYSAGEFVVDLLAGLVEGIFEAIIEGIFD